MKSCLKLRRLFIRLIYNDGWKGVLSMKLIRLLLICWLLVAALGVAAQDADPDKPINTGGFYQDQGNTYQELLSWQYLRFYPDGMIICVSSIGTLEDLIKWFDLDAENVSKGIFKFVHKQVDFSCTSSMGTVQYKGIRIGDHWIVESRSYINGNYRRGEKFSFFPVENLT